MRVRSHLLRLLAATLLTASLISLGGRRASADDLATIKQRGTLLVGVKTDYSPFGFRSPSGKIVGIEPDLAADVAEGLDVKLELVPVNNSNRIALLRQGKVDLLIATMNDTLLRRQEVTIVRPFYYAAGFNVMVLKSMHLRSWAGLKGRPVCGIRGAYYNYEARTNLALQVLVFGSPGEALAALKAGRCDGLLYDDTAIEGDLQDPAWSDYEMPLHSWEVQPWGLAVRNDQPEWAAYLSGVVKKWVKDGTIIDLETKYHMKHSSFAAQAHEKAAQSPGN